MNPAVTKSVDGFLTQSLAKIGHRRLTKGQSNQIKDQFLIELFSVKEVMEKKMERLKTEIERFYWRDEWGFSTKECFADISLLYKEIVMDLNYTRETWSLEDLEGETDWEEIDELMDTLVELKSKNLNIFNKENFGNHKNDEQTWQHGKHYGQGGNYIQPSRRGKNLKCSKCAYKITM